MFPCSLCCNTYGKKCACSLSPTSVVSVPSYFVHSRVSLAASKLYRPIYVKTHCPMWWPSRQSRLPDETLGEIKVEIGKERRVHGGNAHTKVEGGRKMRKQAPKHNEAKSEDKRGAISVAGFMYCQHYPRY